MSGSDDRVRESLAAHLEHAELGGPEPDVSHLTPDELEQLHELIEMLDQTDGIPLGREAPPGTPAATEAGERLVSALRDVLPPAARIATDPAATMLGLPGMDVAEGFIVGTFGGRVRVWLLAASDALAGSDRWLGDLGGVFRVLPDTAAVALVEPDHSCLLVQPEDCAPTIEVPHGSLVARRYRRPVVPVTEAVPAFVHELIPNWEPMRAVDGASRPMIDVSPIAHERAKRAIDEQVAAGGRARKTNPKRTALSGLGETHADALAALLLEIHDGGAQPDDVEQRLRRMAGNP